MIDWESLAAELKRDEGFKPRVYSCSAGKQTVGYGHNLEDCDMTEFVAGILLKHDYTSVHSQLSEWQWYCELDDYRKRIIINMGFNLGVNGLLKFKKMITSIIDRDYEEAAIQMVDSKWYRQVGNRAVRLSQMMAEGE
jgi:lysozyme